MNEQQAHHMELDVYELIMNKSVFSKSTGVTFSLAPPIRCKNMQEVSNLQFIYVNFKEGRNEMYFQYREDIGMHAIMLDPNPDENVIIIALAKFVEPTADRQAVDLLAKG